MTEIRALGFDLIDLAHFGIHYDADDPELLARVFTAQEIEAVGDGVDRLARLAGRFAVKEAVFKALGGPADVSHVDIELVSDLNGAPRVRLSGAADIAAKAQGVASWMVSTSHSPSSAGAVVLAIGGPA